MDTNKAKTLIARDQLVEGHELTTQLQQLLSQPRPVMVTAEDLVAKIIGCFSKAIPVLDSLEPISLSSAVEGSQNASCENYGKIEDSGDSRRKILGPVKGKRGCYKRKKRSETWTVESTILVDAFSWRKYGQKDILNAKFPRSYFRCTHKYTQGCKATKQVQKVELEPKKFNITYIGNHTCNTNADTPKTETRDHEDEIIMDSEEHKSPSLSSTTSMKEEEENHHHHGSSTENDLSPLWSEMFLEEDHQAIYVCGETSTSINGLSSPDLMVFGSGDDFEFSENEQYFSIFDSCSNLA